MIHTTLLVLFVVATTLLMLVTVFNRLRLRRIVFTWSSGRLWGLPLLPTLFLFAILSVLVFEWTTGHHIPYMRPSFLAGYLMGGLCWYIAALLSNAILITEHGIIQNVNKISHAIGWIQIVDYFQPDAQKKGRYAFFYRNKAGEKCRLEITVPKAYRERFEQIVETKLDARFRFSMEQAYGRTTLKR